MSSEREKKIRRALEGAAQLVALFGDEFLPAFIRMEEELEVLTGNSSAVARAKRIAKTSAEQSIAQSTPMRHDGPPVRRRRRSLAVYIYGQECLREPDHLPLPPKGNPQRSGV